MDVWFAARDNITRTATNCTRDAVSHAWVTCSAVPGVGTQHRWTVVVGGRSSNPSTATTSYRVPVLSTISGTGSSNADTAGGQVVYVNGQEFGPTSLSVGGQNDGLVTVYYGSTVRAPRRGVGVVSSGGARRGRVDTEMLACLMLEIFLLADLVLNGGASPALVSVRACTGH